jgi:hypothetical protein
MKAFAFVYIWQLWSGTERLRQHDQLYFNVIHIYIYIVTCYAIDDAVRVVSWFLFTNLTTITYNTVAYFHLNSLKYTAGHSSENWLLTNWMSLHSLRSFVNPTVQSRTEQRLTAGNQPARSLLASSPAGTHGHIFVQCQDFFFFRCSFFDKKGGVGLFIIGVPLLHLIPHEVTLK